MDRNRQKYVELSLAGRWIKLAREIIADNPGIEESRFMEIAVPLMPTHIQRRQNKKSGQVGLAIESLRVLVFRDKSVELIDGKLTAKKSPLKGYCCEILNFATSNGSVSAKDLPHIKNFHALATGLHNRNVLQRLKTGVYGLPEVGCE